MSKRGPNTEKLRRTPMKGEAPVTVIGDLASHSHKLGKGKTKEDGKTTKGYSAKTVAPGNPKSGGPTRQVFGKTMENKRTKGGH